MKKNIAYCGLDCEKCDARKATLINDNALREKVAKHWSELNGVEIKPEMINCEGCREDGVKTPYCDSICPIRQCALSIGCETCGDCFSINNCQTVGMVLTNNAEALNTLNLNKKSRTVKMQIERYEKKSFAVIGKEGSTKDGADFISKLWLDANSHFSEVQHLAKKDKNGNIVGIWGAMSDFSRSFHPWENFEKGLYLAGIECEDNVEAPQGWVKWIIPSYEYIRVEHESDDVLSKMLQYLRDNSFDLVGAIHDYTDPKTGKMYMLFPIRSL